MGVRQALAHKTLAISMPVAAGTQLVVSKAEQQEWHRARYHTGEKSIGCWHSHKVHLTRCVSYHSHYTLFENTHKWVADLHSQT